MLESSEMILLCYDIYVVDSRGLWWVFGRAHFLTLYNMSEVAGALLLDVCLLCLGFMVMMGKWNGAPSLGDIYDESN
jgi:hypothetical protein